MISYSIQPPCTLARPNQRARGPFKCLKARNGSCKQIVLVIAFLKR